MAITAPDSVMQIVVTAVDNFTAAFDRMATRAGEIGKSFEKVGKKITKSVTLPIVALGAASVKMAADFEKGMASVSTLVDTSVESMDAMGERVLEIGARTPVALEDLTGALYDIRSAGIGADRALTDLEKSGQLATAGLGTTKEAANIATSAINAFNLEGERADAVYGQVFTAVKFGKTTISELSQGFGGVAGIVAENNIKLEEFLATSAALTTTGLKASEAYTQQKAALSGLTRQTEDTQEVFKKLKVKDFPELVTKAGGYTQALEQVTAGINVVGSSSKQVQAALKKLDVKNFKQLKKQTGSTAAAYVALSREMGLNNKALLTAFGSTEALNAVLALTGPQAETAREALAAMGDGSEALAEAFDKQSETQVAQWQRTKNIMRSAGIQIGKVLAPFVAKLATKLEELAKWFQGLDQDTKDWIIAIAGIAATVGPAIIIVGKMATAFNQVSAAIKGIGQAFDAVSALVTKHPLLAAITALAVAAYLIYENWEPIASFFKDLWDSITKIFEDALAVITGFVDEISEQVTRLTGLSKKAQKMGVSLAIPGVSGLLGGGTREIADAPFIEELRQKQREREQAQIVKNTPGLAIPGLGLAGAVAGEQLETAIRVEFANAPPGTKVRTEGAGVDLSVGYQVEGVQ